SRRPRPIRRRRSSWAREDMKSRSKTAKIRGRAEAPAPPSRCPSARGTFSIQLLVLLVPVFFGLMGFAVDLGRLYLIRGELNQAASAMAQAAATQLLGTAGSTDSASNAANQLLDDSTSHGLRYNFGANVI